MSKSKKIIWSNNDYDEWLKYMLEDYDGDKEINEELYAEECTLSLGDERSNLNVLVNGCIVGFAKLGLWDGIYQGAQVFGNNVRNILSDRCDYVTWYCDQYNVRCEAIHHDGTNQYLYRVAENREKAEKLAYKIIYEGMTEEQFRKATKSLRPYVANVYGW